MNHQSSRALSLYIVLLHLSSDGCITYHQCHPLVSATHTSHGYMDLNRSMPRTDGVGDVRREAVVRRESEGCLSLLAAGAILQGEVQ